MTQVTTHQAEEDSRNELIQIYVNRQSLPKAPPGVIDSDDIPADPEAMLR